MTEWLISVGPAVGNHLWQSTAFAVLAWGVTLLLRKNQARVRYGVWLAASLKFIVPFSLLIGLGGMLPRPQRPMVTMPVYSAVDEVALPFSELQEVRAMPVITRVSPMQRVMNSMPQLLAVVWIFGVARCWWCGLADGCG